MRVSDRIGALAGGGAAWDVYVKAMALKAAGAVYLMLDIRATGLSGMDFANRLLDATQIAVMPGESFGAAGAGHVRVAMTVDDATFEAAPARLLTCAQELAP